eukprot:TRINITY_DN7928_c0_g1_i7.p1 TRINITY_DN7928_c0_g1~~TRINITY_DN7928_c0_g1_i7.p1  ORF type:complete len:158 (+),score=6.19 TRINITY_DN7928_c0_g1_i7:47-520(+)
MQMVRQTWSGMAQRYTKHRPWGDKTGKWGNSLQNGQYCKCRAEGSLFPPGGRSLLFPVSEFLPTWVLFTPRFPRNASPVSAEVPNKLKPALDEGERVSQLIIATARTLLLLYSSYLPTSISSQFLFHGHEDAEHVIVEARLHEFLKFLPVIPGGCKS